jgi:hypothetical protein
MLLTVTTRLAGTLWQTGQAAKASWCETECSLTEYLITPQVVCTGTIEGRMSWVGWSRV